MNLFVISQKESSVHGHESFQNAIFLVTHDLPYVVVIARAERDGTRAETRFCLSLKRTSPFKSVRVSVQSTAGSRGVRLSLSNAG